MRAVFCDPLKGSWPDWAKFRKYGITRVYVDAREATKALLDGIRSQNFEAGIYRDPNWDGLTADALGKAVHQDLLRVLAYPTEQCAVLFDIEFTHDPQYILDTVASFRKPRPTREAAWTCEPHQGGWFSQALIDKINNDALFSVIPQTYLSFLGDSMFPADPVAVLEDLTARGVKRNKIKLFYDGIRGFAVWADGIAFTDGRLPA